MRPVFFRFHIFNYNFSHLQRVLSASRSAAGASVSLHRPELAPECGNNLLTRPATDPDPGPVLPMSHDAEPGPESAPLPPAPAAYTEYEVIRELGRGGMGVVYLARTRPPGEWNRMEVEFRGQKVRVSVNGEDILADDLNRLIAMGSNYPVLFRARGRTGFQQQMKTAAFRNISIEELTP